MELFLLQSWLGTVGWALAILLTYEKLVCAACEPPASLEGRRMGVWECLQPDLSVTVSRAEFCTIIEVVIRKLLVTKTSCPSPPAHQKPERAPVVPTTSPIASLVALGCLCRVAQNLCIPSPLSAGLSPALRAAPWEDGTVLLACLLPKHEGSMVFTPFNTLCYSGAGRAARSPALPRALQFPQHCMGNPRALSCIYRAADVQRTINKAVRFVSATRKSLAHNQFIANWNGFWHFLLQGCGPGCLWVSHQPILIK